MSTNFNSFGANQYNASNTFPVLTDQTDLELLEVLTEQQSSRISENDLSQSFTDFGTLSSDNRTWQHRSMSQHSRPYTQEVSIYQTNQDQSHLNASALNIRASNLMQQGPHLYRDEVSTLNLVASNLMLGANARIRSIFLDSNPTQQRHSRIYILICQLLQKLFFPTNPAFNKNSLAPESLALPIDPLIARKEVPFECWYKDHADLTGYIAPLKARGWALVSLVEGTARTSFETVCYLTTKLAEKTIYQPEHSSDKCKQVLAVQWTATRLSLVAVLSPDIAKKMAQPLIRTHQIMTTESSIPWGRVYDGTRQYFRPITSRGYVWYEENNR